MPPVRTLPIGFQTRFRQDLRTTRIIPVWTGRTMLEDNSVRWATSMFLFYLQFRNGRVIEAKYQAIPFPNKITPQRTHSSSRFGFEPHHVSRKRKTNTGTIRETLNNSILRNFNWSSFRRAGSLVPMVVSVRYRRELILRRSGLRRCHRVGCACRFCQQQTIISPYHGWRPNYIFISNKSNLFPLQTLRLLICHCVGLLVKRECRIYWLNVLTREECRLWFLVCHF
jgi:hypothetical protein